MCLHCWRDGRRMTAPSLRPACPGARHRHVGCRPAGPGASQPGRAYYARETIRRPSTVSADDSDLQGELRHARFGSATACRASPGPGSPLPCRTGGSRGDAPSPQKGSSSRRRCESRRAGLCRLWERSAALRQGDCRGPSPCSNGPWACVRTRTSRSYSPGWPRP